MDTTGATRLRFLKAYWVTIQVIMSYFVLRFFRWTIRREHRREALLARHKLNARRVERTILELRGMFIKVGQLISIMTNFLPEEFRSQLEGLQDQVPPRPFDDIRESLQASLGKAPEEMFASFDQTPVSSASIGQVHIARLHTGEKVAVKVQYPDIEEIVRIDLRTMRRILQLVEMFIGRHGLDMVYKEVKHMVMRELDFRAEGTALETIARNFAGDPSVNFPRVYWDYSSDKVLVTQYIDGFKVTDTSRCRDTGVDRARLAERIVEAYCKQIFVDGIYHADPHPGNILITPDPDGGEPDIHFLDFGAVAQLSDKMRQGIIEFLQGVFLNDLERIIRSMKDMGFVSRSGDTEVFERVIEFFHKRLSEEFPIDTLSLSDIRIDPRKGLEDLADLRRMDISLRDVTSAFHVPAEYVFLERTVLLLMGLCTHLDPDMNPMRVIRPYLERFVLGDKDWSEFFTETLKEGLRTYLTIPGDLKRYLNRAMRGDVSTRMTGFDEHVGLMYSLGRQLIYTAVGLACGISALVMNQGAHYSLARWLASGAAACGVLLVGSLWTNRGTRWKRRYRRYRPR